ncbi:uncharacterized protein [Choristoneura fumiferana]|uniref:uncharacterized protein n=1 Tax=Choristoneura fumiferana TaxID=7141 RepID=UPI003D15A781
MNSSDTSHCRLCAEKKPIAKLISLASDNSRSGIIQKLKRLNVNTADFFDGSNLPKTVCLICLNNLDKAYEFVEQVENAQQLLVIICQRLKKEAISDDDTTEPLPQAQPAKELDKEPVKEEPVENVAVNLPKKTVIKKQPSQPKSQLSWKDYNWACGKCGTEFPTIEEFKSHSMSYHECCNAFKCTDCNKKMLRLDKFVLHVKRHRKYLKLSCYVCHLKFSSPYKVSEHKNIHKSSEHVCSGCNTEFTSIESLNEHIKLYYKNRAGNSIAVLDSSDSLSCALCKKTFKNKGTLNGHLLVHVKRNPKKRVHICDRCGKGYYNKADLVSHVISLHNDARPYQCEICKSDFKTIIRLKAHVKIHDNFKPFACLQCGRTFRLQKQLRSHEIVHTDSLPFVCPYCSKAFRFKSILDLHLRQHTGDKPYCCELCQRNFTNWSNYNKHMKRRHGTSMVKRKVIWSNDNDNPPLMANVPNEEKGLGFV